MGETHPPDNAVLCGLRVLRFYKNRCISALPALPITDFFVGRVVASFAHASACNFIGFSPDLDIMVLMEPLNTIKVPHGSRKAESLPVPLPVERAITKLGNDLALARRRRRISQESLAIRIGASLSTVKRMEKGDMRIPLHFIARTLHVFGELERLTALIDTAKDDIGLTLADEQLPQRVRRKTRHAPTGAL